MRLAHTAAQPLMASMSDSRSRHGGTVFCVLRAVTVCFGEPLYRESMSFTAFGRDVGLVTCSSGECRLSPRSERRSSHAAQACSQRSWS